MKKSTEELQEMANHPSVQAMGRITMTVDIAFDREYPSKKYIENLVKEWFDDKQYPMYIRISGHAARENLTVGNSVDIQDIDLIFNENLPDK